NQDIETFESFIDSALDNYDYYLVTPHFPLDAETQARALKTLKRIPNRKLIVLDNWLRSLQGNYGAIYQDMANDIFDGLSTAIEDIRKHNKLHVIIHPTSLYGSLIMVGISRFCEEYGIEVEFHYDINESIMQRGNLYLLLNGQLGIGLVEMARSATNRGLQIGKDVGVISYNESYLSEIILGGLTTVSTDFEQMGRLAAQMVLSNNFKKIKCDFKLIRRNTF
ncbi:MAG: LacI family DNA-binding transcriptional regulator, partial [Alistipes sp.]|nr:LacI family DNA-binding transcriptional regulator [Alistipes sp.]